MRIILLQKKNKKILLIFYENHSKFMSIFGQYQLSPSGNQQNKKKRNELSRILIDDDVHPFDRSKTKARKEKDL